MPGRRELFNSLIGTSFVARYWLSLEPTGFLGILVSYGAHVFALFTLHAMSEKSLFLRYMFVLFYVPCSILAMASLFQANITDPGAVPLGARPFVRVRRSGEVVPQRAIRRCHKCQNNYKPDRAHHDSMTGRCIVKFDHFCPWINNAVGALNHKHFCLFLLYTAISCLLSLFLIVCRWIQCGDENDDSDGHPPTGAAQTTTDKSSAIDIHNDNPDGRFLHELLLEMDSSSSCSHFRKSNVVTALTIISLVFLIFTVAMGVEQMEAIETGKGKIARMKQSVGETGTQYNSVTSEFNEMFGGHSANPSWHWFIPIPVRFPTNMKLVVLGYDYDPSFPLEAYKEYDEEIANDSENGGSDEGGIVPTVEDDAISEASSNNPRRRAASKENGGIALTTLT
jgi:DHHC palmitoyltransferase